MLKLLLSISCLADSKLRRPIWRICVSLCVLNFLAATSSTVVFAQTETQFREPVSGILLLRNGQLLGGTYLTSTFGYELRLRNGGIIRLKSDQVEFVSDSIDEIYSFRMGSRVNNTAAAHLEMANWCLNNHLYKYTDFHLRQAIKLNPRQAGIIPIQARLAIARAPKPTPEVSKVVAPTNLVSNEVISQRVNKLQPVVIKTFVSTLQPLLLNKCAVASCHGPNPRSTYQLINSRWTKTTPRGISYRNLYNSMQYVDFAKPESSSFLAKATTRHGGLKDPTLSLTQGEQLGQFVNWVRVLTTATVNQTGGVDYWSSARPAMAPKTTELAKSPITHLARVPIPSKDDAAGPQGRKLTNSSSDVASPASETPRNQNTLWGNQGPKEISLSKDYDLLPFQKDSDRNLKIFAPLPAKNINLTPNLDAIFQLPSDFMNREGRSSGQNVKK